jgi:hypothetical protein
MLQRFEYPMYFGLPENEAEYEKIWRVYLDAAVASGMDMAGLAGLSRQNNLSPRHIENITRRVVDYGLPQEERSYKELVRRTVNNVPDYKEVIAAIGDRVAEYREMGSLVAELKK